MGTYILTKMEQILSERLLAGRMRAAV